MTYAPLMKRPSRPAAETTRAASARPGTAPSVTPRVIQDTASHEREAARIADAVVARSAREPFSVGRTNTAASQELALPSFHTGVQQARRHGGTALEPSTRAFMESRLAHDFSGVRIHDGGRAAELARQVGARAFTIGEDVFFDRGELRPRQQEGQKLIAHELVHVVQQRGASEAIFRKPRAGWTPPTRRDLRKQRPAEDELIRAMHPDNRTRKKGNTSLLQLAHEVTPGMLEQNRVLPPGAPTNAVAWVNAIIVSTTEPDASGAQRPHIRAHLTGVGSAPSASHDDISRRAKHEDDHWTLARMVAAVADRELQSRLDAGEQVGPNEIATLVGRAEQLRADITQRFDDATAHGESAIPAFIWGRKRIQWNRVVRGWQK